ncbi:MAG: RnfABCDGE type electron transport complex subunit G [Desulfobacterales bacterium]|nr:RnfABCDGE type electron transport complex subunit G [Desulfobacterales bacterium]
MREMISMVVVLTVLTAVSGGLLAAVKQGTALRIEEQVLKFQKAPAIELIFTDVTNDPLAERFNVDAEGAKLQVFPAKLADGGTGIAFETKGKGGYGGDVGLMVGINTDTDQIIAVRVTTHQETPGLGSRVKDDTAFVSQYDGKSMDDGFGLKSDNGSIDAISGATITSRAVTLAAIQAQDLYKKLKPEILKEIQ